MLAEVEAVGQVMAASRRDSTIVRRSFRAWVLRKASSAGVGEMPSSTAETARIVPAQNMELERASDQPFVESGGGEGRTAGIREESFEVLPSSSAA